MDKRRSLDAIEKRQNTKSKKFNDLKAKMLANRKKPRRVVPPEHLAVRQMADEYESARDSYTGVTKKIFSNKIEEDNRWFKTLKRAVDYSAELGVDYKTYIKGLFFVSDKWGNRAPKVWELADYNTKVTAKERVSYYLSAISTKEVAAEKAIVSPVQRIIIPQHIKSMNSERQLAAFMKNHSMTEEEVFKKYASGKAATMYFDREWLYSKPSYITLLDAGEV